MLVQHKKVINPQLVAITEPEERVEPPEEGPVVDATGSLRGVVLIPGTQEAAFVKRLKYKNGSLDHNCGDRDVSNGMIEIIGSPEPQGSCVGNITQETGKQIRVQDRGRSHGTAVLNV